MPAAELKVDHGTASVNGDLTFATVTPLFTSMEAIAKTSHMPDAVDLSSVGQIDSAGLALLLEWQSAFRKQQEAAGRSAALMRIDNPPEALLKIAKLCDAEDYLSNGASKPAAGLAT